MPFSVITFLEKLTTEVNTTDALPTLYYPNIGYQATLISLLSSSWSVSVSLKEFTLFFLAILASGAGQFFLKSGALKLGKVTADNAVNHVLNIATNPDLVIGLMCYGVGAVLYILVLTRVNLSVAAPSASIIYIFSVLIGYFAFQEALSINRIIGIGLIVCGVILMAWER